MQYLVPVTKTTEIRYDRTRRAFNDWPPSWTKLRAQCPRDKETTLESLRHLTIEETYELADAIIDQDRFGDQKELGDILPHRLLCQDRGELGAFDITSVIHGQ